MKIQLIGLDSGITESKFELIQKRLITKLSKYLKNFESSFQNATLTISQGTRWGYTLKFNMLLPKNEKIYAQASGKTISDSLVILRDKITKQINRHRNKLLTKH